MFAHQCQCEGCGRSYVSSRDGCACARAFYLDLDLRALDQEIQRLLRAMIGNVDRQGFRATAERAEV